MSCDETMSGHGVARRTDLRQLRNRLAELHNTQLAKAKPAFLKKWGIAKATSRTTQFPFITELDDDFIVTDGSVSIDLKSGTFKFVVPYLNHAVDRCKENSPVFRALLQFINNMDMKGHKYGAETHYLNEFDVDNGACDRAPAQFGAWMSDHEKRARSLSTRR